MSHRQSSSACEPDWAAAGSDVPRRIEVDHNRAGTRTPHRHAGSAGYELDRADLALGTPENAICIARSQDHGPEFELVYEDRLWPGHTTTGDGERQLVRADMVVFETSGGGRVFSTGSITYTGSLPWNDYDNAISTLTGNVLAEFMK